MPGSGSRTVILGKTGSGKTHAALYQLSMRDFDIRPWIIIDFKGDEAIAGIIGAEEIDVTAKPPKRPGVYIVRPLPSQTPEVEELFWQIWKTENIGVFIDEGYMLGNSAAFRALLTQGRSKQIPLIVLSQRPVWLSRFVFSEAEFFQVFWLNDQRDRRTVQSFVRGDASKRLPDYHSLWYDVGRDQSAILAPVPDRSTVLSVFQARLKKRRFV